MPKYIPLDKNSQRRNIAVTGVTTIEQAKEVVLLTEGRPESSNVNQASVNYYINEGSIIMFDDTSTGNSFMWFWGGDYSCPTTYTYSEFIKACTKPKLSFKTLSETTA